jgi:hypothetical protein
LILNPVQKLRDVEQGATALKTKSILDEEYFPLDRIRQGSLAATDLPDGQISDSLSSPPAKNISLFALVETAIERVPSRPLQRGVSRSSRTLGAGCDGRGHVSDE